MLEMFYNETMKIFISHTHSDQVFAKEIASRLVDDGYDVWLPEWQLLPGDNWALKQGQALENAEGMVVLLSPESVDAPEVRQDISYALGSRRFEGRLIPVLVRTMDADDIPWVLRKFDVIGMGKSRRELVRRIADRLERTPV